MTKRKDNRIKLILILALILVIMMLFLIPTSTAKATTSGGRYEYTIGNFDKEYYHYFLNNLQYCGNHTISQTLTSNVVLGIEGYKNEVAVEFIPFEITQNGNVVVSTQTNLNDYNKLKGTNYSLIRNIKIERTLKRTENDLFVTSSCWLDGYNMVNRYTYGYSNTESDVITTDNNFTSMKLATKENSTVIYRSSIQSNTDKLTTLDFNSFTQTENTPIEEERDKFSDFLLSGLERFFLSIAIHMCGLIDLVIGLFKQLIGLEDVSIGNQTNLLTFFLEDEGVKNTLILVLVIGIVLLFIFTIIQMVRSMKNSGDEKFHYGKTFESFLKAMINIILVPVLLVTIITSTNIIMGQIDKSMEVGLGDNASQEISYGGNILLIMVKNTHQRAKLLDMEGWEEWESFYEEHKDDKDNSWYQKYVEYNEKFFPNALINRKISKGSNSIIYTNGAKYPNYKYMQMANWTNSENGCYYVKTQYLNIFVAVIGAFALLFVLVMCSFTFVQRLFDVVLLYIVSPLMIATSPIDDGKRFSAWRDMLISKVLSAYGIIFSVNIYFMIIPKIIVDPGAIFFSGANFALANSVVQLVFVIGGAFAINKANLVFAQLLGSGDMEHQQGMATLGGMANMIRMGAGLAMMGGKFVSKNAERGIRHGVGVAKGGGEYMKGAFYNSNFGQARALNRSTRYESQAEHMQNNNFKEMQKFDNKTQNLRQQLAVAKSPQEMSKLKSQIQTLEQKRRDYGTNMANAETRANYYSNRLRFTNK